uniref:FAD-binding PCMH-type domain-containing protein n=1 Tax=Emiliania huxleyi TaxID=2903 RepID=A0A7S3SY20_EMIHU
MAVVAVLAVLAQLPPQVPTQPKTHHWLTPAAGQSGGVCRATGTAKEHGDIIEIKEWGRGDPLGTEETCATKCGRSSRCKGYEFYSVPKSFSRCEMHAKKPTHIALREGATCKVKGAPMPGFVPLPPLADLGPCLKANLREAHLPGDPEFRAANKCRNRRGDISNPDPVAVARVHSVSEVEAAVQCVVAAGIDACARAGAHGFENDACCSGGVIIDVRDLNALEYDPATGVATAGAGHTWGQLYYKLSQHGRVVPGGTEGGVGVAGLTLGCGRGMLTQWLGLSCDRLRGVEFVDADGKRQLASKDVNPDMLYMAKGGGGNFPGIVTKFEFDTDPVPSSVVSKSCMFGEWDGKRVLKAWTRHMYDMGDSKRQMFSHITSFSNPAHWAFESMCFSCDQSNLDRFHAIVDQINLEASGRRNGDGCHVRDYNGPGGPWLQKLLAEPGVGGGAPEKLAGPPEGGKWAADHGSSKNGAVNVPTYELSDAALDALIDRFHAKPLDLGVYQLMLFIYMLGGDKVESVPVTEGAYGSRRAKWTIHWREFRADNPEVIAHSDSISSALGPHLPCTGFYNYFDTNTPCTRPIPGARSQRDAWLEAVHSDVGKMMAIKGAHDPSHTFRSRLVEGHSLPETHHAGSIAPAIPCGSTSCTVNVLGTLVNGDSRAARPLVDCREVPPTCPTHVP